MIASKFYHETLYRQRISLRPWVKNEGMNGNKLKRDGGAVGAV